MGLLTTFQLVELGEKSEYMGPVLWSLDYISASYPELLIADIQSLPVGTHAALVMKARAENFGSKITAINPCNGCDETVEINCSAEQIGLDGRALELRPADSLKKSVKVGKKNYVVRALSSADLLEAEKRYHDEALARKMLINRAAPDAMAENSKDQKAVEQALEELDPGADIWLTFECPSCTEQQSIAFDSVQYVMREVRHYTRQLLREVALLARAYHWSERDIMGMPGSRRSFYLQEAGL